MDHLTVRQFRRMEPLFADLAKYPDAEIQRQIDLAHCKFNPCVWGCNLQQGEAYWIAHNLLLRDMLESSPMGERGAISKKVGDTAVTYSQGIVEKTMANPYLWTRYGQLYQQLSNSLPAGIGLMIV